MKEMNRARRLKIKNIAERTIANGHRRQFDVEGVEKMLNECSLFSIDGGMGKTAEMVRSADMARNKNRHRGSLQPQCLIPTTSSIDKCNKVQSEKELPLRHRSSLKMMMKLMTDKENKEIMTRENNKDTMNNKENKDTINNKENKDTMNNRDTMNKENKDSMKPRWSYSLKNNNENNSKKYKNINKYNMNMNCMDNLDADIENPNQHYNKSISTLKKKKKKNINYYNNIY